MVLHVVFVNCVLEVKSAESKAELKCFSNGFYQSTAYLFQIRLNRHENRNEKWNRKKKLSETEQWFSFFFSVRFFVEWKHQNIIELHHCQKSKPFVCDHFFFFLMLLLLFRFQTNKKKCFIPLMIHILLTIKRVRL